MRISLFGASSLVVHPLNEGNIWKGSRSDAAESPLHRQFRRRRGPFAIAAGIDPAIDFGRGAQPGDSRCADPPLLEI
jgi:hypothetical protein